MAQKTLSLHENEQSVNDVIVYFQNQERMYKLCEQNAGFLNVKTGDSCSQH
jgi:hypothetical protein